MAGPLVGGGATTTGNISRLLQEGINAIAQTSYKDYDPQWAKLVDKKTSEKAYEEDVALAGYGLSKVKAQGAGLEYDAQQQGWVTRYNHVVYALGGIITMEAIEDDLYHDQMKRVGEMLKRSQLQTKERVVANMFNRGYNSTYTFGDGLSLFNASHKLIKGGTFSNVLSVAADLSEAAVEDAIIAIEDYRDDAGLLINAGVKSLVVPRSLRFEAQRIFGSALQNDTANNATNAMRDLNSVPETVVNHFLEDQQNWFLRTDVPDGGKLFERKIMGQEIYFDTDNDFGTADYRHKAMSRFSVGVTDMRGYFGSGNI